MYTITPLEDWLMKTALVAMGLIIGYFLQRQFSKKPAGECSCPATAEGSSNMILIHTDLAVLKTEIHNQSKLMQDLKKQMESVSCKFQVLHDEHLINHKPP